MTSSENTGPVESAESSASLPLGVTLPQGFLAASTTAGIKPSGNSDMALVVNQGPRFDAAAVFTRNRVVAAPVKVSRAALVEGEPNQIKAVVSTPATPMLATARRAWRMRRRWPKAPR